MKSRNEKRKLCRVGFAGLLTVTLPGLLLLLTILGTLSGCQRVTLHPIEGSDIQLLEAGDNFHAPKRGAFVSDFYLEKVMDAKVKK